MLLISRATKQYVRFKQINFECGCSVILIIVFSERGGRGAARIKCFIINHPIWLEKLRLKKHYNLHFITFKLQFNTSFIYISTKKGGAKTHDGLFPVVWPCFFLSTICIAKFVVWLVIICLKHSFRRVWLENLPLLPVQKTEELWVLLYLKENMKSMMRIKVNHESKTWW